MTDVSFAALIGDSLALPVYYAARARRAFCRHSSKEAPMTLSFRGVATLGILLVFSCTGASCLSFLNTGPAISGKPTENPDPETDKSNNLVMGCQPIPYTAKGTSQSGVTPATTFHFNYTSGPPLDKPILWPKGGSGVPHPVLVWYTPDPAYAGFQSAVESSTSAWNTLMNNDILNPNNYVSISYQTSTNPSDFQYSNVQVYDSYQKYYAQDMGGTGGGNETLKDISSDWSTLLDSVIILDAGSGNPLQDYAVAVHEFGHALGLNHSRFQKSVMFPTTASSTCIFQEGGVGTANFDFADAYFLEANYDPRYTISDSPKCGKGPCPRSVSTSAVSTTRLNPLELAALQRERLRPGLLPNHPQAHWVHSEDDFHATDLSLQHLFLASTLVARIQVVQQMSHVTRGPLSTVYSLARVGLTYRKQFGPDAGVKAGDYVVLADTAKDDGQEFLDEPLLNASDGPTLAFLRRAGGSLLIHGRRMPIYSFTAPYVSKFVEVGGTLHSLGIRDSASRRALHGSNISMLYSALTNDQHIQDERSVLLTLLKRQGAETPLNFTHYQGMMSNPLSLVTDFGRLDASGLAKR